MYLLHRESLILWGICRRAGNICPLFCYTFQAPHNASCIFAAPQLQLPSLRIHSQTQRNERKHCNIICLRWWIPVGVPRDVQPALTNQHIFHSQSTSVSLLFSPHCFLLPFFLNQLIFQSLLRLTFPPHIRWRRRKRPNGCLDEFGY